MIQGVPVMPSSAVHAKADLETVRWRLALVWFLLCGFIFFLLVISVFAANAVRQGRSATVWVRRNFYRLAMAMSLFYLTLLLLTILVQPFLHLLPGDAVDAVERRLSLLETSNLWLAPLQGLVVAVLGVVFFLKEQADHAAEGASPMPGKPSAPVPDAAMAAQVGAGAS